MNTSDNIAAQLNIHKEQVKTVIELLDSGNTIPFIARYRKEKTEELDENQIRQISLLQEKLHKLDNRRQTIYKSITKQGLLTPELHQKIETATTLTELEDLYQPYKPKRRTRAIIARERGLQGLADLIIQQSRPTTSPPALYNSYLSDQVPTIEDALAGARDIVAEQISDTPAVRKGIRDKANRWGILHCKKRQDGDDPTRVYETYYEFSLQVNKLRPHQVLAINRAEAKKILRIKIEIFERDWLQIINKQFHIDERSPFYKELSKAIHESADRLLLPSIERDVRRELTERAETHAIEVFARNLRSLLNQPPLVGHKVLGIDPGIRTGCKVAVVDETGKVLKTTTIYPHAPKNQKAESLETISELIHSHSITLIAIGNGTASRETERLISELTHSMFHVKYMIVSEAGASVYSASDLARSELPDMDVSMRGAVSIARRIQDPLAELVKIDPKSIGVGLYQHDINQHQLSAALKSIVESVVNNIGVDVNTASPALLTYVAGLGPSLAENIVNYRDKNGPFMKREAFLNVPGLGPRAFEQCAGFLRIRDGENFLDRSAIHPESYQIASQILEMVRLPDHSSEDERKIAIDHLISKKSNELLAFELGIGVPSLMDILEQLVRPGRDPREDLPAPVLRTDVILIGDLRPGMILKGSVRNVIDFGAFVDIGVKRDGLLHCSQIPLGSRIEVGEIIEVEISSVDTDRERISLKWVQD
jgi:uncharacterized protein